MLSGPASCLDLSICLSLTPSSSTHSLPSYKKRGGGIYIYIDIAKEREVPEHRHGKVGVSGRLSEHKIVLRCNN